MIRKERGVERENHRNIKSPREPQKLQGMMSEQKRRKRKKGKAKGDTLPLPHLILFPPVVVIHELLVSLRCHAREEGAGTEIGKKKSFVIHRTLIEEELCWKKNFIKGRALLTRVTRTRTRERSDDRKGKEKRRRM